MRHAALALLRGGAGPIAPAWSRRKKKYHTPQRTRVPTGQLGASIPNCLAYEAGAEALPLQEEIWPGPAMKLVGPLAARSPGLRLALALEIERHCSADEILQGRLIHLVAFMDVDGAPHIPVEAGVE
jgi:hypothetical protein